LHFSHTKSGIKKHSSMAKSKGRFQGIAEYNHRYCKAREWALKEAFAFIRNLAYKEHHIGALNFIKTTEKELLNISREEK